MHVSVARLQIPAIATMLRTRLARSAYSAIGSAPTATVTETIDTSAPSCRSDSCHSALR